MVIMAAQAAEQAAADPEGAAAAEAAVGGTPGLWIWW